MLFRSRLDGLYPDTETSVAVVDARLVVEVLDEVDPAALAEVLTIPGRLALRPVLSMDSAAGAGIDPDALPAGLPACAGDPSPGCVDPQTGLTPVPDPDLEALLPSADGGSVYLLGPAALTNHHIAEAVADRGPSGWVVDFGFTAEGEEAFTDVTKRLAGFPVGDPRRGLAIVLDGVVRSAPPIAPDVSPDRGIVGGGGMIALGEADDAATTAFALAAALAVPPLPVDLTVTGD